MTLPRQEPHPEGWPGPGSVPGTQRSCALRDPGRAGQARRAPSCDTHLPVGQRLPSGQELLIQCTGPLCPQDLQETAEPCLWDGLRPAGMLGSQGHLRPGGIRWPAKPERASSSPPGSPTLWGPATDQPHPSRLGSSFSQMVLGQQLQLPRLPELTPQPSPCLTWRVWDLKERRGSPHVTPKGSGGQTNLRCHWGLPPNLSPADRAKRSPDPCLLGQALSTGGMVVSLVLWNSIHTY